MKKDLREYAGLQLRHVKFEVIEFVAWERAKLLYKVVTIFVLLLIAIFISLFASLLLNEVFQSSYLGFGLVTTVWLIFLAISAVFRKYIMRIFFKNYVERNIPA